MQHQGGLERLPVPEQPEHLLQRRRSPAAPRQGRRGHGWRKRQPCLSKSLQAGKRLLNTRQDCAKKQRCKWAYSSAGIDTLGRIIEVVSGQPYEAFLQKRIFEPLGMIDTTFYPTEKQLTRVATL